MHSYSAAQGSRLVLRLPPLSDVTLGSQFLTPQPAVLPTRHHAASQPLGLLGAVASWAAGAGRAVGVNAVRGDQGPGIRVLEWLCFSLGWLSLAKPAGDSALSGP